MEKVFQGRVLIPGHYKGEAVVTHQGFNTLASFQKSMLLHAKSVMCSDQNNPELFGKKIDGVALCLPQTIGSTTGGMIIQAVCAHKKSPACYLFSKRIDSLAASGIVLSKIWEEADLIAIDELGDDFLASIESGMQIEVNPDGTVRIL